MTCALCWSSILYRNLLRLLPVELRREFGPEIALVFDDDLRDAWLQNGVWGMVVVWRCAVLELFLAGLSNACGAPGALVALISWVTSAFCLGGELALARAHAPASTGIPDAAQAVWCVVVWPSLVAAIVSFAAVRAGISVAPLQLTNHHDLHSSAVERPDA